MFMKTEMTRRNFIVTAGIAGAALASLTACGASNASAPETEAVVEGTVEKPGLARSAGSRTVEADVCVVGLGAAGLLAAYGAAQQGVKVVALDLAESMMGVTNVLTSAPFAVGSRLQEDSSDPLTIKEAMDFFNNGLNHQLNQKALRNILEASGRAVNAFIDHGMQFKVDFANTDSTTPIPTRADCWYGLKGEDRAAVFTDMMESSGVDCYFGTTATGIILESGKVTGVQAESKDAIVDFKAKEIVVATGGFLGNEEKVAQYFGGAKIVCMGNAANTGVGLDMALAAGAQIGKCFSISMNEYGGANMAASSKFSFRPNQGTNEAMRLPVFGGLLVDSLGERFIDEGFMCEKTMFAAEPIVREGYHYAVCDEAFMKRWESEALPTYLGDARMKKMFDGVVASDIRDQFDTAVSEGWAFKADTIEDLAAHFELPHLAETIVSYNALCETGEDGEFFKDASYLAALSEAPYYIVQSQPAGWLSLGGIKTDGFSQALDASNKVIDGLFVAGADADLFPSPYYCAGLGNGFSIASGLLAGERAGKLAKS